MHRLLSEKLLPFQGNRFSSFHPFIFSIKVDQHPHTDDGELGRESLVTFIVNLSKENNTQLLGNLETETVSESYSLMDLYNVLHLKSYKGSLQSYSRVTWKLLVVMHGCNFV